MFYYLDSGIGTRAVELQEGLKTDNVDTELKDEVLTVKLPKLELKSEQKARKVHIK